MEGEKIFAYAASIQERSESLSSYYSEEILEDNIKAWLARKSLCTESIFDTALKEQGISKKDFNLGIKELCDKDISILSEKAPIAVWYKSAVEILEDINWESMKPQIIDFSYMLRPFLHYFKKEIEKENGYNFELQDQEAFYIYLSNDLIRISSKTLVFDLHEQKRILGFKGKTSKDRFEYYMKKRFRDKKGLVEFFEEYPVLLRLLTCYSAN